MRRKLAPPPEADVHDLTARLPPYVTREGRCTSCQRRDIHVIRQHQRIALCPKCRTFTVDTGPLRIPQ